MAEGPNEKERPVGHESQGRQAAEHPDATGPCRLGTSNILHNFMYLKHEFVRIDVK
jgi:hypothetical protein